MLNLSMDLAQVGAIEPVAKLQQRAELSSER
jgi:hypothetical protein